MDRGAFASHATNSNEQTMSYNYRRYGFKRYQHVRSNNYLAKEALNCGIRGDKIENTLCRINQSSIPRHTNTVVIICGTNNLDQHKPSDITNRLIYAVAVLQLKHEKLKIIMIIISDILPRKKGKGFRRKKLIETNNMLKYKCSQIPNVRYLELGKARFVT